MCVCVGGDGGGRYAFLFKLFLFYIAEHITNIRFYIAEHITNKRFCREALARGQEKSRNQTRDGIE